MVMESGRELDIQADPQWFIGQLRQLMTSCGAGTATKLGGRKKNQPSEKEQLPHATISRALSPSIQSLPTADFVQRFVKRCIEYADQHQGEGRLTATDRDVEGRLDLLAAVDEEIRETARLAAVDLTMRWSELAGLDTWRKASEASLIPPLGMPFTVQDRLRELRLWMVDAQWPKPFTKVTNAMANFPARPVEPAGLLHPHQHILPEGRRLLRALGPLAHPLTTAPSAAGLSAPTCRTPNRSWTCGSS